MVVEIVALWLIVLIFCTHTAYAIVPALIVHPLTNRITNHFGDDKYFTHDFSLSEYDEMNTVSCVGYKNSIIAKKTFAAHFIHVETIHTDKAHDLTCFLLVPHQDESKRSSSALLTEAAFRSGVTSWHMLHPVLKVHASAREHVSNIEEFANNAAAHRAARTLSSTNPIRVRTDNYYYHNMNTKANQKDSHEYEVR